MVEEKVTVNVRLTINEYDKFTFQETLEKVEKAQTKVRLSVPYAFPSSTSQKYCF
jgi:hypothetical protein